MFQYMRFPDMEITESSLLLDRLLNHPLVYEQGLVHAIVNGRSVPVYDIEQYLGLSDVPIKIEGFEKCSAQLWNACRYVAKVMGYNGPVTCHVFISPEGSRSFSMHTDPDDVIVYMVKGQKYFLDEEGIEYKVKEGAALYIPQDTPHQAINNRSSIMLSFGVERFLDEKI